MDQMKLLDPMEGSIHSEQSSIVGIDQSDVASQDLNGRRKLLLVYIHGFMGDESSFRSFPAHTHNLLAVLLNESHVVHSKIYPRYRSKKNIRIARDDFSNWLRPHEDAKTDVVLLGHSMGGLVSADVAILQASEGRHMFFEHRILGTINFDVPFLGMHHGVVRSGLASIFASDDQALADKYEHNPESSSDHEFVEGQPEPDLWKKQDPNFNTTYKNDVLLPNRSFWAGVQHFLVKHNMNAVTATQSLVSAHVEFMSAMNNNAELKERYAKIRVLEEESDTVRKSIASNQLTPPRIRFINYYTISTGKIKSEKTSHTHTASEATADSTSPSQGIDGGGKAPDQDKTSLSMADIAELKSGKETTELPPFGQVIVLGDDEGKSSPPPPLDAASTMKKRKFCNLPPKDSKGERDPTWVPIFMKNVDEVGAHCGMFFVDERYERLVADVAERIEMWVSEDMSLRLAKESMLPSERVD